MPLEGAVTGNVCKRFKSLPSSLLPQLSPLAAIFICFYVFTHKQGNVFIERNWILYPVLLSLIIHVFFVFCLTISISYPLHQNVLSYLYFKFACLSKIMRELFSFKYPAISDILYLGSISMNICIWSEQHSAAIISITFLSHLCLSIFPISAFIFPYSICVLYFWGIQYDIYILNLYALKFPNSLDISQDFYWFTNQNHA